MSEKQRQIAEGLRDVADVADLACEWSWHDVMSQEGDGVDYA